MRSFGAQYVVHEDSGFLAESVLRIYPLMKKILFMVGIEPWNGQGDRSFPKATLGKIMDMDDPDDKFIIVSKRWATEHDERNEGLRILHDAGCDWCFLVDDDEMYNRWELSEMLGHIERATYDNGRASAFLVHQLIYWKNRETVIENLTDAMPHFLTTRPGDIAFTNAKNFYTLGGVFNPINPDSLVCHHLSYVREEAQMRRRFSWFSHAGGVKEEWIDRVWKAWKPGDENLHPENPSSFKRAVPLSSVRWSLEPMPGRLRKTAP
jgi:hypothetical protein